MKPAPIDGSLEKWLQHQLTAQADYFSDRRLLVDVGAYRGDFAWSFLSAPGSPLREAILFEPNSANFTQIKQRFATNENVCVEPFACDAAAGQHEFFCAGETFTGSLLPYDTTPSAPLQRTMVQCVTLDAHLKLKGLLGRVGLIKIDTQGNDLRVLQGAVELLRSRKPWIVAELIYLPLYKAQAQPHELAGWLAAQGYVMAAQFNENYSRSGWLAWSDACFVPRELAVAASPDFQARPTVVQNGPSLRRLRRDVRHLINKTFRHGRD